MGQWIEGAGLAQEIQAEVGEQVQTLADKGVRPGLAVVLVGDDPASHLYVRNKVRTCETLGMHSEKIEMPPTATTEEILAVVDALNRKRDIHGVLVQIPLPKHVNARAVLHSILPGKDVDGLHPYNVGLLVAGTAFLKPCTPAGIMEIFKRLRIPLRGARAAVIGRSDIVGKPLSIMLLHQDVTVTMCHSKTPDLAGVARQADILVAAMGKPAFIDESFIKHDAVVIDVGTSRVESLDRIRQIYGEDAKRLSDFERRGYTLSGDVDSARVISRCAFLTPVPGGVGPLTIAMLMANTVKAAAALSGIPPAELLEGSRS